MIKKYTSMIFVTITMLGNFAQASLNITFQGSEGQINQDSYMTVLNRIGELVKKDNIRSYNTKSIDIAGSVQVCIEFIGCTNQDQKYMDYLSEEIAGYNFNPAPKFEISSIACR